MSTVRTPYWGMPSTDAMNMVLTLSVYAEIQKALGQDLVYPGSTQSWNGVVDVTDADLLGEQLVWAATNKAGENEAFNICPTAIPFGGVGCGRRFAEHFGCTKARRNHTSSRSKTENGGCRRFGKISGHNLAVCDVTKLASWWHSDSDLRAPDRCYDMAKIT